MGFIQNVRAKRIALLSKALIKKKSGIIINVSNESEWID